MGSERRGAGQPMKKPERAASTSAFKREMWTPPAKQESALEQVEAKFGEGYQQLENKTIAKVETDDNGIVIEFNDGTELSLNLIDTLNGYPDYKPDFSEATISDENDLTDFNNDNLDKLQELLGRKVEGAEITGTSFTLELSGDYNLSTTAWDNENNELDPGRIEIVMPEHKNK